MRHFKIIRAALGLTLVALAAVLGCQTLHNAGVPGLEDYVKPDPVQVEMARSNRDKFAIDRDHKALYWLLSKKVSNGMKLAEVEDVLGSPGEEASEFKGANSDGIHQTTDSAFKWGPDSEGCSVVIWFRDGHVCNFNPKDYRNPDGFRSR